MTIKSRLVLGIPAKYLIAVMVLILASLAAAIISANTTPDGAIVVVFILMATLATMLFMMSIGYEALPIISLLIAALTLSWTNIRLTNYMTLSDIFFVLTLAFMLPTLGSRITQLPNSFMPILRGSLVLLAGAFVATLFSAESVVSLMRFLKLATAVFLIPLIIGLLNPKLSTMRALIVGWIASATISSLYGIVVGPGEISPTRINGLATHPNNLALCCVLAFGPALVLTMMGTISSRVLSGACSVILAFGVVLSGSRAGLLGLVVVLVILLFMIDKKDVVKYVVIATVVVYALFSLGILKMDDNNALDRLFSQSNSASVTESDSGRLEKLNNSWQQILDRPFLGVGLQEARGGHNVYVQLLSSSGILGLLGFLTIAWNSMKPLWTSLRSTISTRESDYSTRLFLIGLVSSYVGLIVADAVSNALWERFVWLLPALIAVLHSYLNVGRDVEIEVQ
ncbi:MAG: O-antigen ligase family protein [Thermomicrobiales bacterium]